MDWKSKKPLAKGKELGVLSMPKVTVVLPTYNGEKYVGMAIESILSQSYTDFELIIVDDCSTDGTNEIATEYARQDDRVKVIRNGSNSKLPKSLNNGFEQATGTFYTWTSDDNLYKKDALKEMVAILETNHDVGMVYCDYDEIDQDGKLVAARKMEEADTLYYGNCVGACFMYRASIAKDIGGYNIEMFLAEDYDYWLRISFCSKLFHVSQNLYEYRTHSGSLSATRIRDVQRQTARLWMIHLTELLRNVPTYQEKRDFFERIISSADEAERMEIEKELCKYSILFWGRRTRKKMVRSVKSLFK